MNLFSGLHRQTATCAVGLDLSEHGLCWVELRQDRTDGLLLEQCLFEALAPGCMVDGQISDFSEVEAAFARLIRKAPSGHSVGHPVAVAMAVSTKRVTVHRERYSGQPSDAALAERVQADMAARLRLSPDEVCVDFHRGAEWTSTAELGTEVLSAAVSRETAEDRLALMEAVSGASLVTDTSGPAGTAPVLRPVALTIRAEMGLHAAVSCVSRLDRASSHQLDTLTALVQVDSDEIQLHIFEQGRVLHSERFDSPSEPGELSADLVHAIRVAPGSGQVTRPMQVWLASTDANVAAWGLALQAQTGLPCAEINPFAGIALGQAFKGQRPPEASRALVACGLALTALVPDDAERAPLPTHFNFLPYRHMAAAKRQKSFQRQMGAVALAVLLVSVLWQQALTEKLSARQAAQAQLRSEVAGVDAEVQRLKRLAGEAQLLQNREASLISFHQKRQQTSQMLHELRTLLPEGLHLNSLRVDQQGEAVMAGQARSAAEVFSLISRLSTSRHFQQPDLLDLSLPAGSAAMGMAPAALTDALPRLAMPAMPAMPDGAPSASHQPGAPAERVMFTVRAKPP